MNKVKLFLSYPLMLGIMLISIATFAQSGNNSLTTVKGVVVSKSDNLTLPATTIVLRTESGDLLVTVASGNDGAFSAKVKSVPRIKIQISYIGYNDYHSDVIAVKGEVLDLGRMVLEEKSTTMQGVTIVGSRKKPIIQTNKDKIIYNAASDISNKSGNAADVLRKAPMLTVSATGELKMRGNSNIMVLINGVESKIMAKNLKEALKVIPASSIVSVEIITSPSAKYQAEGAAGVINIITKKKLQGTSGTLDLSAGNLEQTGNLALNMAVGKLNITAMGNYTGEREKNATELQRFSFMDGRQTGSLLQKNDGLMINRGGSASLSAQYQIDSLQTLEGGFSYWKDSWPQKNSFYNRYNNGTLNDEYRQVSDQSGRFTYKEWVMNYQKKFLREGQELQLLAQRSLSSDFSDYLTKQYRTDGTLSFEERGPNKGAEKDWNFQADYTHPLSKSGKTTMELGTKYQGTTSTSIYEINNSRIQTDPTRSGSMSYRQRILAGYMSLNFETDNEWTFRPGIRFERTAINADFQSVPSFERTFTNWVPNLLIAKKLGEKHELKLNYTERIRRPNIFDLNPYVNASDPLNITQGNAYLKPELTRNLELTHVFTGEKESTLISSLYYSANKNGIETVTTVRADGISYSNPVNIGQNTRIGMNLNGVFKPASNWTVNAGAEIFHLHFNSKALDISNKGMFFNTTLNNTLTLPHDLLLSISGDYGNGFITLQGKNSANYSYRFAISKQFWNKKASITFATVNPFQKTFKETVYAFAPTFQSTGINRFYNRSATLSFSWQFGGLKQSHEKESHFPDNPNGKPVRGKRIR
ncbi:TonB-dependent receptor [Pedobacter sp. SG908]|uniref:TonB-dependent receptor domain-containing protein n=1 Tax=Pedobacter sp. SG908 TaxID=2587135 RepID=UPI00141ED3E8|nr:TonB-dependent receptor [Pedobacter sp. SG908]NII83228.1 outer membrane receptor for ferrienterochelin and colicin [Pedobacter sp. SG908]